MTDTPQPLITIALTCFNAADTIGRALKSALSQDWPHTEILVVDDKSDDNSVDIVNSEIKDHKNVQLIIHEHNQGPGGARKTLLENAKGEYIVFFDDDDESTPNRLSEQYKTIKAAEQQYSSQYIACYASGKRLYSNGYEVNLKAIGSQKPVPSGMDVARRLLYFGGRKAFYGSGTPTCSLMIARKTLHEIGGFDPAFRRVEDVDMAIRLALKGGYFVGTKEPLFTQYSTNASDKAPEKNRDAEIQLAEKHANFLIHEHMYDYAKRWPILRCHYARKEWISFIMMVGKLLTIAPIKTLSHLYSTGPKRAIHGFRQHNKVRSAR